MRKLLVFVFVCVSIYSKSQSQTICAGQSATFQAHNPQSLSNPNYTMNPGNNVTSNGIYVVSPNVTTTYTFLTSGTNSANVTVTTSVVDTLTVNPQPAFNPFLVQSGCTNTVNSVNLNLTWNPTSPTPAYSLSWTPLPASVTSAQQTTANVLSPGPYTVIVTPAGGSCTLAVNFTMTPPPAPANFTVTPFGGTHSITCVQDTVILTASTSGTIPITYTWSGTTFTPHTGPSMTLSAANVGTLQVAGYNGTCSATYTFNLVTNTVSPSSTVTPGSQNITCTQTNVATVSVTANPTINVTHHIYSPTGGIFSSTSHTAIYTVGGPGTYTHVLVDDASGCSVTKNFTITSTSGYPTYTLSSPQNFTLGCTTKSVATINIVGAITQPTAGGPVSYTLLGPPTGSATQSGSLSSFSTYTVNTPGTWTAVVHDNTNNCETKTAISILSNTFQPNISAVVPNQTLTCIIPSTTLEGVSETTGVTYLWSFPGTPGTVPGQTLNVPVTISPTQTLINNYTLTITENNNTCNSTSVIPVYQNMYKPIVGISASTGTLTCLTQTITLTNQSNSGILPPFIHPLPPIGYLWEGPAPQDPLQVSTTYLAQTAGIYTLTSKDLNNGCTSTGTISIADNKVYPTLNSPPDPSIVMPIKLDCAASLVNVPVTVNNGKANLSYSWTPPASGSVTGASTGTAQVNLPGTYTVLVTNTVNGCATKTTMKVGTGSLTAAFVTDKDSGYAPLDVTFYNNSISSNATSGTASITSVWSFGIDTVIQANNSATLTPRIRYNQPGTFTVVLFATKGACLDTAYKVIKVEIPSGLHPGEIKIPNIFSPNGDGANDLFFLKATNLSEINFAIFDRWGHLVYEVTSNTGNIEWDGKNQYGKESSEGIYFFTLKATGKDGGTYEEKGHITLVR
jgi:gliding motility-associated-like protein